MREYLITVSQISKALKGIFVLILLLILPLHFVCARGGGFEIRSLIVFDSSDHVVATIKVRVTQKHIEDIDGRFDLIVVQPTESGLKIKQKASKNISREKIVVIALPDRGLWRPAFAWGDYRLFSRLAVPRLNPLWPNLLVSSSNRSSLLSLNDVESSTSPTANDLWGYRLPAESLGPNGTEFFLARRPLWQSIYSRTYSLTVAPTIESVEFVSSNPPSTFMSFPDQLPIVVPNGEHGIGHVVRIPVQEGKAKLYFIPSDPMPVGDALTIYIRNILMRRICPTVCGPEDAQFCPFECPPTPVHCLTRTPRPFIAVSLISNSPEQPTEARLKIWVGGIDHFTIPYKAVKYYIDFSNGLSINGALADPKRSVFIPWPTNVPLDPSFVTASGTLIDVTDREEPIEAITYKVVHADQAFVGSVGLYAERGNICPPIQSMLRTLGGGFVLKHGALVR